MTDSASQTKHMDLSHLDHIDYGTLTDADTGKPMRPATAAEWRACANEAGDAIIDGRRVTVEGGPDIFHGTVEMYADPEGYARRTRLREILTAWQTADQAAGARFDAGDEAAAAQILDANQQRFAAELAEYGYRVDDDVNGPIVIDERTGERA